MYVRDRNLLKPTGSYLLKLELRKLGIADTDIEDALIGQDEEELAKRALESKGRYRGARLGATAESRQADFQKQAAFLQRRGFPTGIIYKILK